MYANLGRFDGAQRHFQEALRIDAKDGQIHADYAAVLANAGNIDGAIAELEERSDCARTWGAPARSRRATAAQEIACGLVSVMCVTVQFSAWAKSSIGGPDIPVWPRRSLHETSENMATFQAASRLPDRNVWPTVPTGMSGPPISHRHGNGSHGQQQIRSDTRCHAFMPRIDGTSPTHCKAARRKQHGPHDRQRPGKMAHHDQGKQNHQSGPASFAIRPGATAVASAMPINQPAIRETQHRR